MKKLIYIMFVLSILYIVGVVADTNITLTCDWEDTTCSADRYGYLRISNLTNAHAQLMNASGTNYSNILCCNASSNDLLNISKSSELTESIFIKLSTEDNAHVEEPSQINYGVLGVMKTLTSAYLTCHNGDTCEDGYECLYSLQGDNSNVTNSHIGDCDAYNNLVCCKLQYVPAAGGTIPSGGGGTPITYSIFDINDVNNFLNCTGDEILIDGVCSSEMDTTCSWGFDKKSYDINETITFTFYCPDHIGRLWDADIYKNQTTIIKNYKGTIKQSNEIQFSVNEPMNGVLILTIDDSITSAHEFKIKTPFNFKELWDDAKYYIILSIFVIVLIIIGISMRKAIKSKERIK